MLQLALGSLSDIAEIVYVGELEVHRHVGRHAIVPHSA